MTTTDTPTEGDLNRADARQWLATDLPLPTVAELAGRLLQGLHALHDFRETGESLLTLLTVGEMRDVSGQWLGVHREVAEVVSIMAAGCVVGEQERAEVARAMRFVIDTITGAESIGWEYHQDTIFELGWTP